MSFFDIEIRKDVDGMKFFSELIEKPGGSIRPKPRESPAPKVGGIFRITKSDDDRMLAFGWANVSVRTDGELIEDWQDDIVEPEELENAAYKFVEFYVVFTEEKQRVIGIPEGTLPVGWWIGFKVTDPDVWEKVKDGTYSMFSIEGEAERIEVESGDGL